MIPISIDIFSTRFIINKSRVLASTKSRNLCVLVCFSSVLAKSQTLKVSCYIHKQVWRQIWSQLHEGRSHFLLVIFPQCFVSQWMEINRFRLSYLLISITIMLVLTECTIQCCDIMSDQLCLRDVGDYLTTKFCFWFCLFVFCFFCFLQFFPAFLQLLWSVSFHILSMFWIFMYFLSFLFLVF